MTNDSLPRSALRHRLLDPSELGTREYWNATYSRELSNYGEDAEDEGTVWFSENNAEEAVLKQLSRLEKEGLLRRGRMHKGVAASAIAAQGPIALQEGPPSRFLDLGTGNGHMLFTLQEENEEGKRWSGEMLGVDYSETSVQLARRIAAQRLLREVETVQFEQWDLLNDSPRDWLQDGFEVVLDKGTFDAISLMPHSTDLRHPCEVYREKVLPLIKPSFFLFITSCNWTKMELLYWLAPSGSELQYYGEAKYPTFAFGGQIGQSTVTLILRRSESRAADA